MKFEISKTDDGYLLLENQYYRLKLYRFESVICAEVKPKNVMITLTMVNNTCCIKLQDIGCSVITAEDLEKLIPSLNIAVKACKEINRLLADNILDTYNVSTINIL